ncbi:Ral guanine nucleotide dissociation stimulator-like 1 [Schistosoma japonicum]|nr:Ral guanine nucleotide dissociation stimulator-like 1 [Schistosoma japonicum]
MAFSVNKVQTNELVSYGRRQQKLRRVGSLVELLDFFVLNEGTVIDTVSVNTFLYTYRLFADIELVLEVVNKKFWNLCQSNNLPISWKVGVISSLQYFIGAWLQQPHIKDFDSPQRITRLKWLVRILASWFDVFQPFCNQNSHTYVLNEFLKFCGNNVTAKNQNVTRIVLSNIDSDVWNRLARDMEYLCRKAVNCLKNIACKYQIDLNLKKDSMSPRIITVNRVSHSQSPHNSSVHKSTRSLEEIVLITPSVNPLINLWNLNVNTVAEQLTVVDQRLFLNIELNDCLIYARGKPVASVQAVIDQYNKLYNLVQSSLFNSDRDYPILVEPTPIYSRRYNKRDNYNSPMTRVSPQIITIWSKNSSHSPNHNSSDVGKLKTGCIITWINIAYRLGQTRNYSALKAIIMALQSTPVLRLWHSWNVLEYHYHEHFMKFKHLAALMSFDNNQEQLRMRLNKCAKKMYWYLKLNNPNPLCGDISRPGDISQFENSDEENSRETEHSVMPNQSSYLNGVIPYLGVFLSDLTLLHHSSPDYISRSKYLSSNENIKEINIQNQKNISPTIKVNNNNNNLSVINSSNIINNNDISTLPVRSQNNMKLLHISDQVSNFAQSTPDLSSISTPLSDSNQNTKQSLKFLKNTQSNTTVLTGEPSIPNNLNNDNIQSNERDKKIKFSLSRRHSTVDSSDDKLINLDKHRREFKVLANLFLLQQNAQLYSLRPEPDFITWLHSYPLISETEAFNRSCEIEPGDERLQQHLQKPFSSSSHTLNANDSNGAVDMLNTNKPRCCRNRNNVNIARSKYAITRPPSATPSVTANTATTVVNPNTQISDKTSSFQDNKSRINETSHSSDDFLDDIKCNRSTFTPELIAKNNLNMSNQLNNDRYVNTSTSRWDAYKNPSVMLNSNDINNSNNNLSITVSLHQINVQNDGRVSPFLTKVAYLGGLSQGSGYNDNHSFYSKHEQPTIQLSVSPMDNVSDVLSNALKLFGCHDQNVDNYDLIHTHKDAPDVTLSKSTNFYESINYHALPHLTNCKYHDLFEFICMPIIHNVNSNHSNRLISSPSSNVKITNKINYHAKKMPQSITAEYAKQYQLTNNKSSNKHCVVELWS